MDLKVSVYLQKSASTCSLDYWHTFSCLVVRQDTSSIQVSNHSEEWYRTLLDFPRLLIRRELQVSHRTGQSTIGHTGWYGMTYKEDVEAVKDSFKNMFEKEIYKTDLFADL